MSQTKVTSYFNKGKRRVKAKVISDDSHGQKIYDFKAKCFNFTEISSPAASTKAEVLVKPTLDRERKDLLVTEKIQTNKVSDTLTDVLNSTHPDNFLLPSTPQGAEALLRTPKRLLSDPVEASVSSKKRNCGRQKDASASKNAYTPSKDDKVDDHHLVRKRLILQDELPKKDMLAKPLWRSPVKFGSLAKFANTVGSNSVERKEACTDQVPTKHLVQETPSLCLPPAYKLLSEFFHCTDTVVSMLYNRKESCTFAKLKKGVQSMTKRQFTETNLGQIKTVCSSLFYFNVEKTPSSLINRCPQTPLHQLVITPNLKDYKQEIKDMSPVKLECSSSPMKTKTCPSPLMSPLCLVERKKLFISCLLNITKQHHQDFLSKLDPPVIVPMDKLTSWHPKFDLTKVPDIDASPMPQLPDQQKIVSAKDMLNKFAEKHCDSIKRALEFVASKTAQAEKVPTPVQSKNAKNNKWLKGIDTDLLQRIRQRESAKNMESMITDPKDKKRKKMLERVPELVRILRTHFLVERKAAISLEDATKKLVDSCRTFLSAVDAEEHIKFMADIFPKWLLLFEVRKRHFLKIDKNTDINVLLQNMPKQ